MWDGRLGHWVNGLQFQKGLKLFVRGPKSFFFFWKLTYLEKKEIWARGAGPPPVSVLGPMKPIGKQNRTQLITIQQYKSQMAKNLDGKLKNKDETY